MFVLANFLYALATILRITVVFWEISIIISAIMSFFPFFGGKIKYIFDSISDIILKPIRKFIPTVYGPVDFSPFIALLVLVFVDKFIVQSLFQIAVKIG